MVKVKVIPQQTKVAEAVPGRLRPGIFLTFGTTKVVRPQPYAPAAFTPGKSLLLTFRGWVDPRQMVRGIDPGTSQLVM